MSITELLQRVTRRQMKRERDRRTSYHQLVRSIAEGQEPETDVVEELLHHTGKSVDDLAEDVSTMANRIEWCRQVTATPKLRAEVDDLKAKIAECDEVLKAATEKHEKDTNPLYGRMSDANKQLREASYAERGLRETCLDDDLLTEIEEVTYRGRERPVPA